MTKGIDDHYKKKHVTPFDVMKVLLTEEEYRGYKKGNIIKYAMRQGDKEGNCPIVDAIKCYDYMIALVEGRVSPEEVEELYWKKDALVAMYEEQNSGVQ